MSHAINRLASARKNLDRASLTFICLSVLLSSAGFENVSAAQPANTSKAKIASGEKLIATGQYGQAVKMLEGVVLQSPQNSEAHYQLGKAYLKSKNYSKAREHLRLAMRFGHGSIAASQANALMLTLPQSFQKPLTGANSRLIASMLGLSHTRGAEGPPKPTVLNFYAKWCHPCHDLDSVMDKMHTEYGDRISIMRVDVDDPKNSQILEQYQVSPIPTVVFLNPEGEVVSYAIGYSGERKVSDGVKKALGES